MYEAKRTKVKTSNYTLTVPVHSAVRVQLSGRCNPLPYYAKNIDKTLSYELPPILYYRGIPDVIKQTILLQTHGNVRSKSTEEKILPSLCYKTISNKTSLLL
jgi:hypothetical protein